ncbi:MAG: HAD-IIB family hydrolase [Pseudomonadota bacterium]|nr:HAD-IIB family hydrolase [Pseudomonadota bacterium]
MQPNRLRPLDELGVADVAPLVGVLFDIDDTVTLHGRIVPSAFAAMARAKAAGLQMVPVTGRPAGWVDHIARMWPVDGVVGENGGLWFYMRAGTDGVVKLQRRFLQPEAERVRNRTRLEAVRSDVLRDVPGCAIASDQPYRELDLAVDFCEDVPPLGDDAIDRIVEVFDRHGATSKVSSIHVNGWFGTFDKLSGFERLAVDLGVTSAPAAWAYIGDSANDGPMFAHFPLSVGVANVDAFLPRLPVWPRFRTDGEGGHGFTQLVDRILALRA